MVQCFLWPMWLSPWWFTLERSKANRQGHVPKQHSSVNIGVKVITCGNRMDVIGSILPRMKITLSVHAITQGASLPSFSRRATHVSSIRELRSLELCSIAYTPLFASRYWLVCSSLAITSLSNRDTLPHLSVSQQSLWIASFKALSGMHCHWRHNRVHQMHFPMWSYWRLIHHSSRPSLFSCGNRYDTWCCTPSIDCCTEYAWSILQRHWPGSVSQSLTGTSSTWMRWWLNSKRIFWNQFTILFFTKNKTPLHYAAWNGHDHVVEWLINHGANLNALDIWVSVTLNSLFVLSWFRKQEWD